MKNIKLCGFVRMLALGCLAVCGLEAFASGGVNGKPNLIEGGYVYYYATTDGNAPWYTCSDNVYGRIPHQVEDYIPPMGRTNAIFLARSESFSVPNEYEFVGTDIMNNSRPSGDTTGNVKFFPDGTGTRMVFKMTDNIYASPEKSILDEKNQPGGTPEGGSLTTLCFRHALEDGTYERCMLQIYHVNRSDAFYRIPRGNDTYYVKQGTTLWFCDFDPVSKSAKMLWSPWANTNGAPMSADWSCDKWSFVKCTAKDTVNHGYFDKFTITAEPNETVVLQSVDGTRKVTVHVVNDDFRFTSHVLLFKYGNDAANPWFETRKLSTILTERQEPYSLSDIESVVSSDAEKGVAVVKDEATGDYSLTPLEYHDFDRYVTVTLTGNRGVILLKITSLTGRCDETLCARVMPKVVYGKDFSNLIRNNAGALYVPPNWETCTSPNAPPGYTDIRRTPACVLYEGKRYSLYAACKSDLIDSHCDTENKPTGQTECVLSLRKIVAWLEDLDGNMVASPALCIGNVGFSNLHATRFCLGTANCLYTNDPDLTNLPEDPTSVDKQYCDEYYLGTTLTKTKLFQGAPADEYGYCAVLICAGDRSLGRYEDHVTLKPWIDEMTVFLVSDVRTVTVTKEVVGGDPTEQFPFVETHEIYDEKAQIVTVTNIFSLADGESWSFAVATGGCVRVTELTPEGYVASVRTSDEQVYTATNEFFVGSLTNNLSLVFRNTNAGVAETISLWITDHEDAGNGLMNLAFTPIFDRAGVPLGSWLNLARAQDVIHVAHAEHEADIRTAEPEPVTYPEGLVDRDLDKYWVWITADISSVTNVGLSSLYWKILVDPVKGEVWPYDDETLTTTLSEDRFTKTKIDASTALYSFNDPAEAATVEIKRDSRVKSLILVGGGGGGGAADPSTSNSGGGGGGGEVRRIGSDLLGSEFLAKGQTLWLNVGKGGAPSSTMYLPGDNGEATRFTCGDLTWNVLGGGGGGSCNSKNDLKESRTGGTGANGGGGANSANGGATTNGIGYAGGKSNTSGGGGGGMTAAGTAGSSTQAGAGGEGLTITIEGRNCVFGAGGGGGGKTTTTNPYAAGLGGTNAGDGAYAREGLVYGEDALAGFGGGGGGGGAVGGHGGNGAVIIELQDASTIDAVTYVNDKSVFSADLTATLKDFTAKGTSSSVYFAIATGTDDFVFGGEPIATGVVPGNAVPHTVQDLWSDTDYRYAFKFVDDLGNELVTSGAFHTKPLDFPVGYEDDYVIVQTNVEVKTVGGEYLISAGKAITNAEVIVKRDILLREALVVGGGGAGGSYIGGGGGGGGVVYSNAVRTIVAGTKFLMTVGAGGAVVDAGETAHNKNGERSTLSFGENVYAALGGGAGASRNNRNGNDGANGGGGAGYNSYTGRGGASSDGVGFAGGDAPRKSTNTECFPGGGGGASECGQDGGANESNYAGKGGEGLVCSITGETCVYGSGGGGGGIGNAIIANVGGTNAGAGGQGVPGEAGRDGFGAGGGGGSYNNRGLAAGRGGDGTVIFKLLKNDAAYGTAEVLSVDYREATLVGTLLTVREGETTASIAFSCAPEGQPLELTDVAEQVAEGTAMTNRLTALAFGTTYAYRYDFITADGALTNSVNGTFYVETGFEDENAVITGVPNDFAPTPKEGTLGVYAFTDAGTQGRMLLKGDVDVNPLTVGDGSTVRAVGPDGREIDLTEEPIILLAGTEISFAVGEGSDGVSLTLKERSPIQGRVRVQDARPFVVTLTAEVLALGETIDSVDVSYAYAEKGGQLSDFVSVTNGLVVGDVATIRIPDLDPETVYDYEIRLTGGGVTKSIAGSFKSAALDFTPGYEDDFVVVNGSVAAGDLRVIDRGDEKVYVFTNVARNARLLVRKDNVDFAEAVVVGGGGGGGYLLGGGGGGGGVVQQSDVAVLNCEQELGVVVGAGGAGSTAQKSNGADGSDSSLTIVGGEPMVAKGGGGGASWNSYDGGNGGSGGGAGGAGGGLDRTAVPVPGQGTPGQGYDGGAYCKGPGNLQRCPGGGGGASETGGSASVDANGKCYAGKGGEGRTLDITGEDVVYGSGGGGGGGGDNNHLCAYGPGGVNGGDGGNPSVSNKNGQPGVNGTGGGGGGASYNGSSSSSGRGGDGTVIIRLRVGNQPIYGTTKVTAASKGTALVTGTVASLGEGVDEVEAVYYAVESAAAPKKLMLAAANVDPKYAKIDGVGPLKVGDTFSFKIPGLTAGTQYRYTLLFVSGEIQQPVKGRFETAPATAEQVAVNEIMASNGDSLVTANGGEGLDWIELRNDGDQAENVSGWYLSDNPDKAEAKWKKIEGDAVVPAHGTLIVWADKEYEAFTAAEPFVRTGLGKDGGSVFLANPLGEVLSRVDYPEQIKDISYGPDTSGKLGFFDPSTPGVANGGNALNLPTPAVAFDVEHGYKTETFTVGISCASDDKAEIHYTTNGAKPTLSSPLYTDRIAVSRTTCLRAAVVDENSVLQNDASATYIFLDDVLQQGTATPADFPASGAVNGHKMLYGFASLPAEGTEDRARLLRGFTNSIATISLVADPKDLFDSKTGIYVNPSTSKTGIEWERKIMVEQIDPTDARNGFSIPAGLRLRGAGSRTASNPKHSLRLFFRGKYGAGSLKFPLFGDEGADEFDKVDLRTSQNYSWASSGIGGETFVHETFARDTQRDMGVYYTRSRYYNLYINGQYWGLYQTQERGDEDYAETYAGGKADDYDIIKTDSAGYKTEVSAGTDAAWKQLWTLAVNKGGTQGENYMQILGCNPDGTRNPDYPVLLNRDNLIAFVLNAHYMVDGDSPYSVWGGHPNNLYALRDRKDGKAKADGFFFLRHDAEHSMGTSKTPSYRGSYCRYDQNPTGFGNDTAYDHLTPFMLNIKLCDNADYKMAFADAFYRHCLKPGGALTDEKALARFRSRMAEIDDAIVCEACRWGRSDQKTRETWLKNCDECLYFITNRLTHMTQQYRNKGWYPSIDAPTVTIADGKATFTAANPVYYTLDGSDPRTNGILAEGDVTLPASGTTVIRARCKSGAEWSAMDEETFVGRDPEMDAAVRANLRVAEVMSAPLEGGSDGAEYVVLTNCGDSIELALKDVRIVCWKNGKTEGEASLDLVLPEGLTLAPGASVRLDKADYWPAQKITDGEVNAVVRNGAGETVQTLFFSTKWWDGACKETGASFVALDFGEAVTEETQWRPSTE